MPAEILDAHAIAVVVPKGQRLPNEPEYRRQLGGLSVKSFLVSGNHFLLQVSNRSAVTPQEAQQAAAGSANLHVIGFVDYRDRFGRAHRAGYGRTFVRTNTENNLTFLLQDGYNYDRPIGNG